VRETRFGVSREYRQYRKKYQRILQYPDQEKQQRKEIYQALHQEDQP
jgi:hypothetical protein